MKAHLGRIKLIAVILGAVLAAASLIDFNGFAQQALWSEQDAAELQEASVQLHQLNYETPQTSGLSAEELAKQRARAKKRFDTLEARLDAATASPQRWRRVLLATAVVCLCVGLACHFASG